MSVIEGGYPVRAAAAVAALAVTATEFLTGASAGALIAALSQPFGAGTTYAAVGAVPAQLALSNGTLVVGGSAAVAGSDYTVKIRAASADGKRELAETFVFRALQGTVTPPQPAQYVTVAPIGSSTYERYFSDYTGPANAQVTYSTNGVDFQPLATMGAGATVLGDEVQRATGKAVRLLKLAERGSKLSEWIAASSPQRMAAVAAIKAAGDPNTIVPIYIGGNDAIAGGIASEAQHLANYRQLIALVRSETGFAELRFLVTGLNQLDPTYSAAQKAQLVIARRVELQVAEDANCRMAVTAFDLALSSDGLHMAEASYPIHARRLAAQAVAWITGTAEKRSGRIVSAVRISDTRTRVAIVHGSGTDFTPKTAITGFTAGAGAISAAEWEDATHIVLTHASSGGQTFPLSYVGVANPDLTGILYDNSVPPLPFEPGKAIFSVTGNVSVDFLDSFTAPDATVLASGRVSDSGHIVAASGAPVMDGGMARGAGTALLTYPGFKAKALTTSVRATLVCRTNVGSIWLSAKVIDTANQLFAGYRASAGGWVISQRVGDVATDLGTAAITPVAGTSYVVQLDFAGDAAAMTVRMLVNNVEVIAPKAITNADIRAALSVGARFATANTATTGWAIDKLETIA